MSDLHPIKVVARRTGLSPHVIRAWEKRHSAVLPQRTGTNRRVYTKRDIERLSLLRQATLAGRSIGQIAGLPTDTLRELVREDRAAQSPSARERKVPVSHSASIDALDACWRAVETLDPDGLEDALERAVVTLSRPSLVDEVITPLMNRIGDAWRAGTLRAAHEHLASARLRIFVENINGSFPRSSNAPRVVITTPSGQLHELGALLASTAAASEGWDFTYLGPSLSADEIAAAVRDVEARAVALSISLPDDPHLARELTSLAKLLPHDVAFLVGGRGSAYYSDLLAGLGAKRLADLWSFRLELESLRSQSGPGSTTSEAPPRGVEST